jgi:prepilin-type N-terminal cleavage/methylation domain-containing protein
MLRKVRSFTLVELIIVVIIVGILASLGLTQYSLVVERGRTVEAAMNFATMRHNALAYTLEKGSFAGIAKADLGVEVGQIPSSCVSTHYYYYTFDGPYSYSTSNDNIHIAAVRCTSGGKPPQAPVQYVLYQYAGYGDGYRFCYPSPGDEPCPKIWP